MNNSIPPTATAFAPGHRRRRAESDAGSRTHVSACASLVIVLR